MVHLEAAPVLVYLFSMFKAALVLVFLFSILHPAPALVHLFSTFPVAQKTRRHLYLDYLFTTFQAAPVYRRSSLC